MLLDLLLNLSPNSLLYSAQIANIGIRPYTQKVMSMRARSLAAAFPQYKEEVIIDFSEAVSFYDEKHGIRGGSKY